MQTQIGFIIDSAKAFDEYMKATGELPPAMPPGKNTIRREFTIDLDGTPRAAMLVKQTGFAQTPEESERGDEASGLSLMIATELPPEQGASALREVSERMLWPNEAKND